MQPQIKHTLVEVRKAYRFLFEYQKRILDLIRFIGRKYGFSYSGGFPKYSNPTPRRGRGSLSNWSWDWLNFYFYEFNFVPKIEKSDMVYFSVFAVNDTGFFDARNEREANKLITSTYNSVDESESRLIFVAGRNLWLGWGVNWDEPEFISQPYGKKTGENNGLMIFKHYPIDDFENEDKTIICLRDFEKFCFENEIKINIKISPLGN